MAKLKIGLTGGIASGKSTVAEMFKALGVDVFDADIIAKQLLEQDEIIQKQVLNYFGTLDRAQLRNIIFHEPQKKLWLENLLHPPIIQTLKSLSAQSKSDYCILVIPLLFETACEKLVNYVVVVDASEPVQKQRLKQRDNNHDLLIENMIKAQLSRPERLKKADFVIHNEQDLTHLALEVKNLHEKFLEFCAAK